MIHGSGDACVEMLPNKRHKQGRHLCYPRTVSAAMPITSLGVPQISTAK